MNTRDAILKAADMIERNPNRYRYMKVLAPAQDGGMLDCNTPYCALGWIAGFLGTQTLGETAQALGCVDGDGVGNSALFYDAMNESSMGGWTVDAVDCAQTLRRYADEHHPATEQATPDWNAIATRGDIAMEEA